MTTQIEENVFLLFPFAATFASEIEYVVAMCDGAQVYSAGADNADIYEAGSRNADVYMASAIAAEII